MELLITAILIGLVIYGLEHNRARQTLHPNTYPYGSTDIQDRDNERIINELQTR